MQMAHNLGRFAQRLITAATVVILALQANAADAVAETKTKPWETTASTGVSLTKGNSDTLLWTANILALKKWEKNEARLGADATYGENSGTKNAESFRGFAQWNWLFQERAYAYLRAEAMRDTIADIDYRFTLSPGVGYYFIKGTNTTLSAETGPGFIYEKQGGTDRGYFTLRVAERFEHKFNEKTKMWQSVEFLPQVDQFKNYIINAEIGLDTKLTAKLSLRIYAQDTYDNEPAPGRKKNDVKLVTALAYTFN
jgi:putative salt-induced outer membrane protein YdiY